MMSTKSKESEKGAGLIEILIVSGVLLFVIQFLMQSFLNFKSFQKYENMQLSTLFLKNYINEEVDCEKTMAAYTTCTEGQAMQLIDRDDQVLIATAKDKKYSVIKKRYQVRAICSACEDCPGGVTIDVESRIVNSKGKPVKHPLRGKPVWVSLYKKVPFQCSFE